MKKTAGGLVWVLALGMGPAMAGSTTGTFNVTATVLNNCAVSAADLAFGNYSAGSTSAVTASTNISVTCAPALSYTVSLDGGTTNGTPAARAMTDGATHKLTYGLYTTTGYATILGDGTGTTATLPGVGTGSIQTIPIYGKIPAAQYVNAGSYTDRVTVTVAY